MILIRYYGAPRGSFENSNNIEFSASACQKIHSELLASVNQIYVNLQDSGLKTTSSSSSSSLSVGNKLKMQKTGSVDLKPPDTLIKEKQRETNQRARYKMLEHIMLSSKCLWLKYSDSTYLFPSIYFISGPRPLRKSIWRRNWETRKSISWKNLHWPVPSKNKSKRSLQMLMRARLRLLSSRKQN